ncbi:DNA-binding PadR family transcriptional regulator [Labrenzia sp. EL_13]|nr:DNA-binding PadR family transcriptional regulator [Labrenzia sp. EL_13]
MIGKFEECCLMALIRSGPDSTPAQIYDVLCEHGGKEFKFGATYTTLDRMEAKGWVKVTTREPTVGGKKRRYFSVTGLGEKALNDSLSGTHKLASGLGLPGFAKGGLS